MKALYLDFDGVITHIESGWELDPKKIELIKHIVEETDAKIIVISSWKVGCKNVHEFILCHYRRPIDGLNDDDTMVGWLFKNIYDLTPNNIGLRGDEVELYNKEHDITEYCIIDDDVEYTDDQLFKFVQTDTFEGITEREAKLAIAVLNNKTVYSKARLNNTLKCYWKLLYDERFTDDKIFNNIEDWSEKTKNIIQKLRGYV